MSTKKEKKRRTLKSRTHFTVSFSKKGDSPNQSGSKRNSLGNERDCIYIFKYKKSIVFTPFLL